MCGIAGVYRFDGKQPDEQAMRKALDLLKLRGPDGMGIYTEGHVCLGHTRLAILDTTDAAAQPMVLRTPEVRAIAYNGEIFNYKDLKSIIKHVPLRSSGDTEVLFHLMDNMGNKGLPLLNGFFAFAFYNQADDSLLLARDRYGVKPLWYYQDDEKLLFASELKALLALGAASEPDWASVRQYLELNYIPGNSTIYSKIHKVKPGHYLSVKNGKVFTAPWYRLPAKRDVEYYTGSYAQAKDTLYKLMDDAVASRMIADVPLGTFLSGGIDSSIVTALAAKQSSRLKTFSITFPDNVFFDESPYSRDVAAMYATDHTEIPITEKEMLDLIPGVLEYLDEPFADSSAIAVYALSKEVRKYVTVALSGDGADEVFGGYMKHQAWMRSIQPGLTEYAAYGLKPLWGVLPSSRGGGLANKVRRAARLAEGLALAPKMRYYRWAGITPPKQVANYMQPEWLDASEQPYGQRLRDMLMDIDETHPGMYDCLKADVEIVLPGDMLTKVDMMSMANSLEVRNPFLDYRVVEFAMAMPDAWKTDRHRRKIIIQEAFREILPANLFDRPKKGFEVPLAKWLRGPLKPMMTDLLSEESVKKQGILKPQMVKKEIDTLLSANPGDAHARVWAMMCLAQWWRRYRG